MGQNQGKPRKNAGTLGKDGAKSDNKSSGAIEIQS
jgi:hypothetical protein